MNARCNPRRQSAGDLVTHLHTLALDRPNDTALVVATVAGEVTFDYAELDRRVRALAAELQTRFQPGDRALLLLDNDEHYVVGFLACLYAGLVAVPAFPPESVRPQHLARLRAIANDAQARCAFVTSALRSQLEGAGDVLEGMDPVVVDAVPTGGADRWRPWQPEESDIAFLQYTSGSTAAPKGVIVDHGNLLANELAIQAALQTTESDVFVSWLPLFHDMGLVGGLFHPLYCGIPLVLVSPAYFLERPVRWLELLSRHRGTISGGPDFAYRLCLERITDAQLRSLDLSTWRIAFSGAEPVRHGTLHAFAQRFASAGFNASAIYPCYGLAEATLLVTGVRAGGGMTARTYSSEQLAKGRAETCEVGTTLVACGTTQPAHRLHIVDPSTGVEQIEGHIGEIWASGPSVSRGYWQQPEQTANTFVERDGERWLRTGDLGFVQQGQLYVAGRLKDLIILRGHNIYPQDLELAVESAVEVIRKGRVAAFAVTIDGVEGVGIAVEVSRGLQKLVSAERLANELNEVVSTLCHEPLTVAVLLNPGGLPKTSSGKVQRSACREGWQRRSLDAYAIFENGCIVAASAGPKAVLTQTETEIAAIWRTVLRLEQQPAGDDNFFALGGSSVTAAQVLVRIERQLGVALALRNVFAAPSLRELAGEVERARSLETKVDVPAMACVSRDGELALSPAQQRMALLWQLDPQSAAYNVGCGLRLRGPLDSAAVRRVLHDLGARHEVLRTRFPLRDAAVAQEIQASASIDLDVIDLRALPVAERDSRAQEISAAELQKPFDLQTGPVARATLLALGNADHLLLITIHHIAVDGASVTLLVEDFIRLYATREPLPPPAFQYADYAAWQRAWLESAERERQLAYWSAQLGREYPDVRPRSDRPASRATTDRGQRLAVPLDADLARRLLGFAKEQRVTLFMILLAAWKVVLARHSGQEDVRVGAPVTGRRNVESESIVGPFVNTVVLRTHVAGDVTVSQLLQRVARTVLDAHAHQDLPFEQLVEALATGRSGTRHPLFQVMHNHQRRERTSFAELAPLHVRAFERHGATARFDLTLNTEEEGDTLSAAITYSTALYDEATIARLAEHWLNTLQSMAASPELRIDRIPMLSQREIARHLYESNATARDYGPTRLVHERIERQAAATPDAPAVIFGSEVCSYRELNRRANRLARALRQGGVGPDELVGIYSERSVELIVGLLAIVKSGGAYVPLDPSYPEARLAFLLEDAQPRVLLAERRVLERLPAHAREVAWLLDDQSLVAAHGDDDLPNVTHPDNLVYCLYTSGSTGLPKCAANTHAALLNQFMWRQDVYAMDASHRVLHKTPIGFDVSVWEVFWPLMTGASLVVAQPDAHKDPWCLREIIDKHAVTTLHFVPPMLNAFLEASELHRCESLRHVFIGGQALSTPLQAAFFRQSSARLHHLYGPTEAAIDVSFWECSPDAIDAVVPIGRPIANTQLFVLDASLMPVSAGVVGDLYIGGVALARGYVGRLGLTADRFVPNPFTPGARMYRTGDLARYRTDGALEFVGRSDHQVKVRGFRIELGEIETCLREHAEVREAVVQIGRDRLGENELIAYVACAQRDDDLACKERLHRHLALRLPDYMLPMRYLLLDSLPLLPNGKIDRIALFAHEALLDRKLHVSPRDAVEQRLADIWSDVLQVEAVGIHDDFFALGGHSLLATKVIARVRRAFDIDLPLKALFEATRLDDFTGQVRECIRLGRQNAHGPIAVVDRSRPLPLSYSQQRMWTLWLLEPDSAAYNLSGAVQLTGPLDADLVRETLATLIQRHETLRTTFRVVDGSPMQFIAGQCDVPLARLDLSGIDSAEQQATVQRHADEEGHRPFDLQTGPLLRVLLLKLAADRHAMIVTTHHVVAEGWAIEIFAREFIAIYGCLVHGKPVDLAPLPVQYVDYVHWQQQWLLNGELERQLSYWTEQFAGEHDVLALPTDRPRPKVLSAAGEIHRFRVEPVLAQRLRAFSAERGTTLFMTLLTGFFLLLQRHSGQRDLRVGVPVANRVRPEAEGLIGAFLNTQVLRCRLDAALTLAELLAQVRQTVIAAQSHQDLPFDRLVEAIRPSRSLSHHPLFQAMFNLHRWDFQRRSQMGDVVVEFLPNDVRAAKLDLMLDVGDLSDALDCCLTYSADLFERATVERMAEHWVQVLAQMVDGPQARIGSARLLTRSEEMWLSEWGSGQVGHVDITPMHRQFEQQVALHPEAIALIVGRGQISYGALNAAANRLAHRLIALGVAPEVRVAIAVERSVALVVGLLAVLKAGGSYVPLDPAYPQARLDYMMQDCRAPLLLTQRTLANRFASSSVAMLLLDEADWNDESADDPRLALHPEHPAYTIYTSGSTGRPKGVVVRHGALSNFLSSMREEPGLKREDVLLAVTSLSFDIAALEIFLPLTVGARIVLATEAQARDGAALAELLQQNSSTVLQATPSGWRLLLASDWQGVRAGELRGLCGGEALPPDLAQELRDRGVELWNMYGPTETTIWSSTGRVTAARPSLGRPIAETRLQVLTAELEPAAVGVSGELYIGGAGLARGYFDRTALTAERFIADPFRSDGSRLYRTGDRVRWTAGGELEFLSRNDQQVKIRGFRIELGEIEAQLLAQPEIHQAAVLARSGPGGARLIAYVVNRMPTAPALIRERLSETLPEHMVPSVVLMLERMPLTDNGKLDRKALPEPDAIEPERYEPPHGELETSLAAIWSRVLKADRVGRHDNFFALGGDSILTVRIVADARAAGWKITPRQLFERQTIAQLAEVAEPIGADAGQSAQFDMDDARAKLQQALGLSSEQVADVYPLTSLQTGVLFHSLREADHTAYVRQLRVDIEDLDVPRFKAAWRAACERHEILRTGFVADDDLLLQWVSAKVEIEFSEYDGGVSPDLDALAATQLAAPFDLARPSLMRFALARVDATRHHFIWTHHHLLTDGWSAAQLLNEVVRHYAGESLAPVTSRFRDYVYWLQRQDQQAAECYWRAQLQGLQAPTLLTGSTGIAADERDHATHIELFDREQSRRLEAFGKSQRVTLNTLVQAAWAVLLNHLTAQQTVAFGVTTAGRPAELPGVDRMVGLFINTYPVVATVGGAAHIGDWLRGLQAQNVAAREHEHTPLHELQRWAGKAGQGLFDTLLVFENYPIDESLQHGAPGQLRFSGVRHHDRTHYPLTITATTGECLSLRFGGRGSSLGGSLVDIGTKLRQTLLELADGVGLRVGELSLFSRTDVPMPEQTRSLTAPTQHEAPRSEGEVALAAIWSDVLSVKRIGRHDSFFELGGDSILAMRLVTRIKRELNANICLAAVFEHRTLARMSATIAEAAPDGGEDVNPLVPIPRVGNLSLSPAQLRLWVADRLGVDEDGAESAYAMSAALELRGELDVSALRAALQTLVERHEVLRTCYPEEDGDPYAMIQPVLDLELPLEDLSGSTSEVQSTRLAQCIAAHRRRFDLASGPLFRGSLIRFESARHVLVIAVHHIAFDGWSQSIFVRELVAAYVAISNGSEPQLEPLPIQYVDYAAWHARKLSGRSIDAAVGFWRGCLQGAPALSTIAGDFQKAAVPSNAGDAIDMNIDPAVLDRLRAIAQKQNTTLFTVLFSAFSWLLHQETGASDLVIGTDVAGRQHPHLEALLGFFVNVVPLRSKYGGGPMMQGEWLSRTHSRVLSAFEHQDVPFDQLVELSGVPRARNHNPLVQVLFVLQNLPSSRFEIPGLDVTVLPSTTHRSKFDLAVFVQPDGRVSWIYSSALYRRETVQRWVNAWSELLQTVALAADPSAELLPAIVASQPERESVQIDYLRADRPMPLVVTAECVADGPLWAGRQRSFIESVLLRHAAILFRNFGLRTVAQFEAFASAIEPELFGEYGDLPRQRGGQKTYQSTPYPADKSILFHNESSHLERWPRKQWFFCEEPSPVGGATPIVDCREVLTRLPAALVERLQSKGLLYVRTFTKGLDVDWRDFFKTNSKEEVNRKLRRAGIDSQWLGGEELQTRTRCPAVIRHPLTGERVFFNQLQLHHPSCLDPELRADLLMIAGPDRMPRNVFYGDGSVIDDEDVALIVRTYEACAERFSWQRGDVLMLDNMLAAHARDPYEGPRKIVVAMSAMFDRSALTGPTVEEQR